MKIAFLHTESFFTSQLMKTIRTTLAHHEVVEWIGGKDAPALDFDVLLAMGSVGRTMLLDQPKLKLMVAGHVMEFANGMLETAKKPLLKPPKPAPAVTAQAKPPQEADASTAKTAEVPATEPLLSSEPTPAPSERAPELDIGFGGH